VSGNCSYLVGESPTSPCCYHSTKGLIARRQEMIHHSLLISIVVLSNGFQLQEAYMDGEVRNDNSARHIIVDEYFYIYGQTSYNLFRFSPNNC
jgi:hypothetical protein